MIIYIGELAQRLGRKEKLSRWQTAAEMIREDIINQGWNVGKEAFTQHYGTNALDTSVRLLPLLGFLPVSDRRITSTIAHATLTGMDTPSPMTRYTQSILMSLPVEFRQ